MQKHKSKVSYNCFFNFVLIKIDYYILLLL